VHLVSAPSPPNDDDDDVDDGGEQSSEASKIGDRHTGQSMGLMDALSSKALMQRPQKQWRH